MYVCMYLRMYHCHWVWIFNQKLLYITERSTAVCLFCVVAGFPTLFAGIRVNVPSLWNAPC